MAGAMRKMAVYLGLVEDDRYDDYDDGYDDTADRGDRMSDRHAERGGGDRVSERIYAERGAADRVHDQGYERVPERSRPMAAVRDEASVGGRAPVTAMADRMSERRTSGATALATAPAPASDLTQITTIHPRTYNEAKAIGEHFRGGTPVIMNLTEMDDSDAKRLVDFAAGLVFGLHGTIERVTNKVFLLSPANVTVTAEDKARMRESGFFNQS